MLEYECLESTDLLSTYFQIILNIMDHYDKCKSYTQIYMPNHIICKSIWSIIIIVL